MILSQILSNIEILEEKGNRDVEISGLKIDSRKVVQGDLFICLKGFQVDGHSFIEQALQQGAKAIITEKWLRGSGAEYEAAVLDTRLSLAGLANNFYSNPTSKLSLYGITGTNGKTTTSYLIESILRHSGQKTGLIGTVKGMINGQDFALANTTPESLELQGIFKEMVNKNVDSVVMEVSSHALDLHRVDKCQFDVAIFTNLSQDHLDYHKDMEDYFRAKRLLFEYLDHDKMLKIINADDEFGQRLLEKSDQRTYSYGLNNGDFLRATDIELKMDRTTYTLKSPEKQYRVELKLPGLFNVYNSLAAAAACYLQGVSFETIIDGMDSVQSVPGRFELVKAGQDFVVIVDYAHTPDSLEKVTKATRDIVKGKIITVFGCGGDRDRTKRPLMGKAAVEGSDYSIITSDNPRSEEPMKIIEDILTGINQKFNQELYEIEANRQKAIERAFQIASCGDAVIIAGKGHEEGQIIKDKVIPFSDKKVAETLLKERYTCCP